MVIVNFVSPPFHFDNLFLRLLSRIILIPVVAGIAYEFMRFTAGHLNWPWVRALIRPGLQLQRLTTREPDEKMTECAIAALRPVLAADGSSCQSWKSRRRRSPWLRDAVSFGGLISGVVYECTLCSQRLYRAGDSQGRL